MICAIDFRIRADEPSYPKSMYLLQPLRTSFELNYVAPHAQSAVPVPEGLDLERWIVPPPKVQYEEEEVSRKPKKSKTKGKERSTTGKKGKKKTEPEVEEISEEKIAREKVSEMENGS